MTTFVYLGNYTPDGLKGAMQDGFEARVSAVRELIEAHGGEIANMARVAQFKVAGTASE